MRAKHYKYTVADLAKAAGVSRMAVYKAVRRGQVDLTNLISVSQYITSGNHRRRRTKKPSRKHLNLRPITIHEAP